MSMAKLLVILKACSGSVIAAEQVKILAHQVDNRQRNVPASRPSKHGKAARHRRLRINTNEIVEPRRRGDEGVDPVLKALIKRGLKGGYRVTAPYAREQLQEAYWPIGLCIAWVLKRSHDEASEAYAHHRVGIGLAPIAGWTDARTALIRALAAGEVVALGIRPDNDQRIQISAAEWIDLRIRQRGMYDEIWRATSRNDQSIVYRDVRIGAQKMQARWPLQTHATKAAFERREAELLEKLKTRMLESRDKPTRTKKELMQEFPNVSKRAFGRLYTQSSFETGSVAWSKGGRRLRDRARATAPSGSEE
jgi:hypothetical protein